MFTGIIESVGKIVTFTRTSLTVSTDLSDIKIGDSIAVDGCCLTVREIQRKKPSPASSGETSLLKFNLSNETVTKTTLGKLSVSNPVNLERAVSNTGRFGGHFVTGHIDGTGKIIKKNRLSSGIYLGIEIPHEWDKYIVSKGSLAVDGISLTVNEVQTQTQTLLCTFILIPHTQKSTYLNQKDISDDVNIELDILAKYVNQMESTDTEKLRSKITYSFLQENGFI